MTVTVSSEVLEGLEFVRSSGETNMMDYHAVMRIAFKNNYFETVSWMMLYQNLYIKGFMEGFTDQDN